MSKHDDSGYGIRPPTPSHDRGGDRSGGAGEIAPGKRTATDGLRATDPITGNLKTLGSAEAGLQAIGARHLPAMRDALAARRMGDARRASGALTAALTAIDRQLASVRRWAAVAGSDGALALLAPLEAELATLRADAAPSLELAPPAAPPISLGAAFLPVDEDWTDYDAAEAANQSTWESRLDAAQTPAGDGQLIDASDRFGRGRAEPVQRKANAAPADPSAIHERAAAGVAGTGGSLPHLEPIQRSFGVHDVTGIRAHVGGSAAAASAAIGAEAYATGNDVAFAESPSLFVAAHEAAHVVQQRAGVSLFGGVGAAGDTYEQHADAVAEQVVRGESAEVLLGPVSSRTSGSGVQRLDERGKGDPLVLDLLAGIDGAARSALNLLDEGDDAATPARLAGTIVARIDHLRSIVLVPGKEPSVAPLADDAALAFGHAQALADRFLAAEPDILNDSGLVGFEPGVAPTVGPGLALREALALVSADLVPITGWTWKSVPAKTGKAGEGFGRKQGAAIVTQTLEVIERRIDAVRDTTELTPIRVTFGAVIEDLGHAAREAELVATDAKYRKLLAKDIKRFVKTLHRFRDRIAGVKAVWVALPISRMRDAESRLLESVGLPSNAAVWDDGAANAFSAEQRLADLRERRDAGEEVAGNEQDAAQQEALAAADVAIGVTKDHTASGIGNVVSTVQVQITQIEFARTNGYQDALTRLALQGLDDYDGVWTSFGDLLLDLGGMVPHAPTSLATQALGAAFKYIWASPGASSRQAAATASAMARRSGAAMPSGGSSAELLQAAKQQLGAANTVLCNAMRRDCYEYLAHAIAHAPPDEDTDAQTYAADLQVALQHALFGEVFALGLADGALLNAEMIAAHARRQLLNQYVLAHGALGTGGFQAARSFESRASVGKAVEALGGDDQVQVEPDELVYHQIQTAVRDLGCVVSIARDDVKKMIEDRRDTIVLPVTGFDPREVWGGGAPSRWMNPFQTEKIAQCEPHIDNEAYIGPRHLDIDAVEVRREDLDQVRLGKQKIYNLARVRFQCRGLDPAPVRGVFEDEDEGAGAELVKVAMPDTFSIRYWIGP